MNGKSANFVLIRIAVGEEDYAYHKLREIEGISGIHFVYGQYDMVLVIEEKDSTKLRDIIMKKIRGVKGVIETTTLVAAD
ncbi:MAG: Lrp/AsnC ligand binding domain-containing protein [Methanomassiliicoccales archaeon]|nr:MAG: Lrp/AsnC ligand binding domain-containing protein [Methanomassiliicoccales archaeon]